MDVMGSQDHAPVDEAARAIGANRGAHGIAAFPLSAARPLTCVGEIRTRTGKFSSVDAPVYPDTVISAAFCGAAKASDAAMTPMPKQNAT